MRAGDLTWSCWDTALHVADALYFYAAQLIYKPVGGHVPTELTLDDTATVPRLLDMISVHAELLRRTVLVADAGDRAHHAYGASDPEGFTAMGLVEMLVHTYDLDQGLGAGSSWRPPSALAGPALLRLFPQAPAGEPGDALLYCCGRAPLGPLLRLATWRWDGAPTTPDRARR